MSLTKIKKHFDALYTPMGKDYVITRNDKYELRQLRYVEHTVVIHKQSPQRVSVEVCEPKEYINTDALSRGEIKSSTIVYTKRNKKWVADIKSTDQSFYGRALTPEPEHIYRVWTRQNAK